MVFLLKVKPVALRVSQPFFSETTVVEAVLEPASFTTETVALSGTFGIPNKHLAAEDFMVNS